MIITKTINAEELYSHIHSVDILEYYTGLRYKTGRAFKSPLREDNHPSFLFGHSNGVATFKDLTSGDSGDAISFVALLYSMTRTEAIDKIYRDLVQNTPANERKSRIEAYRATQQVSNRVVISVKEEAFNSNDIKYWSQYGISLDTLEYYNIYKLKSFTLHKDKDITIYSREDDPIYCYDFGNDNYKIYRPHNKQYKWTSNTNVVQGLKQIDKSGEVLIITKSLKDVACIRELGYNAIAPHAETSAVPKNTVEAILKRYKRVYVFYDNDYDKRENWGQKAAMKVIEEYPEIRNICIGTEHQSKDVSDFIVNTSKDYVSKWLQNQILIKDSSVLTDTTSP